MIKFFSTTPAFEQDEYFTLFVKSPEKSGLLIDGATEAVKHEIRKQKGEFLGAIIAPIAASLIAPMVSSLIQPVVSSLINAICGKGVTRAGKGQEGEILPLLALPLMMNFIEKELQEQTNLFHPLSNTKITKYFNYEPRFNGVFERQFP